jgi:hypothetical protein
MFLLVWEHREVLADRVFRDFSILPSTSKNKIIGVGLGIGLCAIQCPPRAAG